MSSISACRPADRVRWTRRSSFLAAVAWLPNIRPRFVRLLSLLAPGDGGLDAPLSSFPCYSNEFPNRRRAAANKKKAIISLAMSRRGTTRPPAHSSRSTGSRWTLRRVSSYRSSANPAAGNRRFSTSWPVSTGPRRARSTSPRRTSSAFESRAGVVPWAEHWRRVPVLSVAPDADGGRERHSPNGFSCARRGPSVALARVSCSRRWESPIRPRSSR